jgi:tyrosyl-tRNA synthetase
MPGVDGIELIRRVEGKEAYGMTFTLLTTSEGKKMGKTERGALWLDPEKTPPYEFYQYWRNVQDADTIKCLKLLTFISMDQIREMEGWKDQEINKAKKILAFELTRMVHGDEEALKAQQAAEALFGGGGDTGDMPSTELSIGELAEGINILELLQKTGLVPSKGEGRRLVTQGGVTINDNKVEGFEHTVTTEDFSNGELILKKGKKTYHKVILKQM